MSIQKLSASASKDEYVSFRGTKVKLGKMHVKVTEHRTKSRGGTWATGFRFYETYWAMLVRENVIVETLKVNGKMYNRKGNLYSTDHGKTWHKSKDTAMKSKGKMKLSSSNHGEMAFEGIQMINRKYDSTFKWRR